MAQALEKVGPTYRPLTAFIAETGARVSEALAVRFGDLDLQARTWAVAGQLLKDGTVRLTKTPGSMATVPLSARAVEVVKRQRQQLMRNGFLVIASDSLVFVNCNSEPLSRYEALRHWQNATQATLGVPVRLHDLRTTFASRLAANGVDVPTAQALLRHARPSTTLDVYTRLRGDAAARSERMRAALDA